jgi:hypothetical protein
MCLAGLSGDGIILCDLSFIILCDLPEPHVASGDICEENIALQAGTVCSGNHSKV